MEDKYLVFIGNLDEFILEEPRRVCVSGLGPVAVFRTDDGIFALADQCSHGDASLADGWLEGHEIECPAHGGRFDIRTGDFLCWPLNEPVASYPVTVENEKVFLTVAK